MNKYISKIKEQSELNILQHQHLADDLAHKEGGYGWEVGVGKSNRCIQAYSRGMLTAGQLAKILKTSEKALLADCSSDEWHHTGSKFRQTHFYDIDTALELAIDWTDDKGQELKDKAKAKAEADKAAKAVEKERSKALVPVLLDLTLERRSGRADLYSWSVDVRGEAFDYEAWIPDSQVKTVNGVMHLPYWLAVKKFGKDNVNKWWDKKLGDSPASA